MIRSINQIEDRLRLLQVSKVAIEKELDSHHFPEYSVDEDFAYSSVREIASEMEVLEWVLNGE